MGAPLTFKRVLSSGWLSFRRNGSLTVATILVMILTLSVIGGLLLLSVVTNSVLRDLEQKIDILVKFNKGTPENQILSVKRDIEALEDVAEVSYISADEALVNFRELHKNDPDILASLEELGSENPLPANLSVVGKESKNLAKVAEYIRGKNYPAIEPDGINYFEEENQRAIKNLSAIVRGIRTIGISIILVLGAISMLIAYNTVWIAIFTAREEINIMKLVGATNWYVRGPFIVEGALHGALAALVTTLLFFPVVWVASFQILKIGATVNLQTYFNENFVEFGLILLVIGVILGVGSSMIAIRRYLKI